MNRRVLKRFVILGAILAILAGVVAYAGVRYYSGHRRPATQVPAPSGHMMAGEPSPANHHGGGGPMAMNPEAVPQPDMGKGKPSELKPNAGQKQPQKGKPTEDASAFRQQHKQMFGLMNTFLTLAVMERSGKSTLTPAQAKQVLDVMTPLKSKPKLTEVEAGKALTRLNKVLTPAQLKTLAEFESAAKNRQRPDQRQQAGPPPGAPGQRSPQGMPAPPPQNGMRRQGPPPPGSPPGAPGQNQRPRFDPAAMKDFNPFYTGAATGGGMGPAMGRHFDAFFEALKKDAGVK